MPHHVLALLILLIVSPSEASGAAWLKKWILPKVSNCSDAFIKPEFIQNVFIRPFKKNKNFGALRNYSILAFAQKSEIYVKDGVNQIANIYQITEKQLRDLPVGTVLIDTKTHEPMILGLHFFNFSRKEPGTDLLEYGFSSAIAAQPFINHPSLVSYLNSKSLNDYAFPGSARNYISMNFAGHSERIGDIWSLSQLDGTRITPKFSMADVYSRSRGGKEPIAISKIYIWANSGSKTAADALFRAGETMGAHPQRNKDGDVSLVLTGIDQISTYYRLRIEQSGGLEAMATRFNALQSSAKGVYLSYLSIYDPALGAQLKNFLSSQANHL